MFDDKVTLITGGAGYLGRNLARHICLNYKPQKVIIYSRDPHKHKEMQRWIEPFEQLRYILGDIRDRVTLSSAMRGVDYVIHAAALKDVPQIEHSPSEAMQINVVGTEVVLDEAWKANVSRFVFISSDKAVEALNFYGKTKAMGEALTIAKNIYKPIFSAVRYGNVIRSTGSVYNVFREKLSHGKQTPLPVTDKRMTRYWMDIEDAIGLVDYAFHRPAGLVITHLPPSFRVVDLARALYKRAKIEFTGIRRGEKLHETLIAPYEVDRTWVTHNGYYYEIEPEIEMPFPYERAKYAFATNRNYCSDDNNFLTQHQIREKLSDQSALHQTQSSNGRRRTSSRESVTV